MGQHYTCFLTAQFFHIFLSLTFQDPSYKLRLHRRLLLDLVRALSCSPPRSATSRILEALRSCWGRLMLREPWIYFCGPKDPAARQAIVDSLSSSGVLTRSWDISAPADDGIICFSDIDDELCEFVREVSHNREKRVVAVPSQAVSSTTNRPGVCCMQARPTYFYGRPRLKWRKRLKRASSAGVPSTNCCSRRPSTTI